MNQTYSYIESKLQKASSQPKNTVQIDVISDLHLEFHVDRGLYKENIADFIKNARKPMTNKSDEILIVGGDISGNNLLSEEVLRQLSLTWEYVLVIPGNHDWYSQDKYKDDRYKDLIESMEQVKNVIFLMDVVEIFEYKGIKIAGTMMFYNLSNMTDYIMWKSLLNDSRFLTREFVQARNTRDVDYYNRVIDEVDIFVSHVPIVNLDGATTRNLFLNVDVEPKSGTLYLSGHTHYPKNSVDVKSDYEAINVSYGYPSELSDARRLVSTIYAKAD